MKKSTVLTAAALALTTVSFFTPFALADTGPHGCVYASIKNGHSISTFCPHYAPYEAHQAVGKIWINSGYSTKIQTPITMTGRASNAGYYHGGQVFEYWQNRW